MSFVIVSLKKISVTKLLELQDKIMLSSYDEKFVQTTLSIVRKQPTHTISFVAKSSKNLTFLYLSDS